MKKASLTVLVSISVLAGTAYAQARGDVRMSTDPAKAAEVEQRAQAIQAQRGMQPHSTMSAKEHKAMHHHNHKKAMKKKAASAPEASQ